jgi:hypothetical protein
VPQDGHETVELGNRQLHYISAEARRRCAVLDRDGQQRGKPWSRLCQRMTMLQSPTETAFALSRSSEITSTMPIAPAESCMDIDGCTPLTPAGLKSAARTMQTMQQLLQRDACTAS